MSVLVDSIYGDQHNTIPLPGGIQAAAPTSPLPMTMLDSLTVHAKMRYTRFIYCDLKQKAHNAKQIHNAQILGLQLVKNILQFEWL